MKQPSQSVRHVQLGALGNGTKHTLSHFELLEPYCSNLSHYCCPIETWVWFSIYNLSNSRAFILFRAKHRQCSTLNVCAFHRPFGISKRHHPPPTLTLLVLLIISHRINHCCHCAYCLLLLKHLPIGSSSHLLGNMLYLLLYAIKLSILRTIFLHQN